MNREQFIELVLTHHSFEGGAKLWNDPDAGWTKYGFSQRAYPHVNIQDVGLDWAKEQAYLDYWKPCRCDEMPFIFAMMVFDFAFNSGTDRAIRYLQTVLGVVVDGKIGPKTLAAAQAASSFVAVDYLAHRALFMAGLASFKANGKGWMRRLFALSLVSNGGVV